MDVEEAAVVAASVVDGACIPGTYASICVADEEVVAVLA